MQTVTFNKVFKAEGSSQRGPWVRWDYKTEDGGRFPHFAVTQEIPLNTAVNVQTSAKGDIKNWEVVGGVLPADPQQTPTRIPEAVRTAPVASQGQRDFEAEARGKTKCALWSALLPAMYASLPKAEQTVEAASQLVDYAMGEVFPEDVPF